MMALPGESLHGMHLNPNGSGGGLREYIRLSTHGRHAHHILLSSPNMPSIGSRCKGAGDDAR